MKTKGLNFPSEQVLKGIAHKAGFPSHKVINKWSGKHLEPLKFEDFDKPISKFYVTWSEFYHKI